MEKSWHIICCFWLAYTHFLHCSAIAISIENVYGYGKTIKSFATHSFALLVNNITPWAYFRIREMLACCTWRKWTLSTWDLPSEVLSGTLLSQVHQLYKNQHTEALFCRIFSTITVTIKSIPYFLWKKI